MNYLLDTCVVSELVAKRPEHKVMAWIDGIAEARLYLSVITIGELNKGIEKLSDSPRRVILTDWLNDQLLVRFVGRIVAIDIGVMLKWGQLTGLLERAGKTMSAMDSLIAATALHENFNLVTRNEIDFQYAGVSLTNPWK